MSSFGHVALRSAIRYRLRGRERVALTVSLLSISLCGSNAAQAQSGTEGNRALPAIGHVGLPLNEPSGRVVAAETVGLGITEAQGSDDGAHERLSARSAVSVHATPGLAFAFLFDGRYDMHPHAVGGFDDGWLVRPEISSRISVPIGELYLGAEVAAWLPEGKTVASSFGAVGLDTRMLAAERWGAFTLGGQLGFRLDRGADAAGDTARLSHGDRLALAVSDFNGILTGLGASYLIGKTQLLGEVSADFLVGKGAPKAFDSPLRLTAGTRSPLAGEALTFELLLDAALSNRPDSGATSVRVPIEPRITISLGIRYVFGARRMPASLPPGSSVQPDEPTPPKAASSAITDPPLEITLTDENGAPLEHATVELVVANQHLPFEQKERGHYRLEHAKAGSGRLRIHADGQEDFERELEIEPGVALNVDVKTHPALPAGQLRGLVRSFNGRALVAKVRIEPGGLETSTDKSGFFQIDVPPGDYETVIEAPGFASQRRKTHVEQQGVVIVNADLSRGR